MQKLQLDYKGAIHHVCVKGVETKPIFTEGADYDYFHELLAMVNHKYGVKFYLYRLGKHQIHLLLEVGAVPLSTAMQLILNCYTRRLNKKRQGMGRVFAGRYASKIILDETYLRELTYYLHFDKAVSEELQTTRVCSTLFYQTKAPPFWLVTDKIERVLSERHPQFLSSGDFSYTVLPFKQGQLDLFNRVNGKICRRSSTYMVGLPLERLLRVICEALQISDISSSLVKMVLYFICDTYTGYEADQSLLKNYLKEAENRKLLETCLPRVKKALVNALISS